MNYIGENFTCKIDIDDDHKFFIINQMKIIDKKLGLNKEKCYNCGAHGNATFVINFGYPSEFDGSVIKGKICDNCFKKLI